MKNTTKSATQVALEIKRQELKDIKAAAKRAQADLKKNGVIGEELRIFCGMPKCVSVRLLLLINWERKWA